MGKPMNGAERWGICLFIATLLVGGALFAQRPIPGASDGPTGAVGLSGVSGLSGLSGVRGLSGLSGLSGAAVGFPGSVTVFTDDHTLTGADCGTILVFNATGKTLTLASPPPTSQCPFTVMNIFAGNLTISRNTVALYFSTGSTSNMTLTQGQTTVIKTDGTSYYATNPI